jgi:Ca-activated chloride channel family protein
MSTPRINPNDPKWTAYVLGELDDAERAAVERLIESSPDARALIDELAMAATAFENAFDAEPAAVLTPAQRAEVRRAADRPEPWWFGQMPMRWVWSAGTVMAAVIVAVVLQWPRSPELAPSPQAPGSLPSQQQPTRGEPSATSVAPRAATPARESSTGANSTIGAGRSTSVPTPTVSAAKAEPFAARSDASASLPAASAAVAPSLALDASPLAAAGATFSGTVRDATGSVLPGVTVTATNLATLAARTTVTDGNGRYTLRDLDPGQTYRLTASLAGFQSASRDLPVSDVVAMTYNFNLTVGSLAETITITGETPVLDARSTTARQVTIPSEALAPSARSLPQQMAAAPAPPPPAGRGGAGRGGVAGGIVGGAVGVAGGGASSDRFDRGRSSNTESYARVAENGFVRASQEPLATFSIDVDTASFSNIRRFLNQNQMPPRDAVRIEELVNYFTYDYPNPSGNRPIAASLAVTTAPWNSRNRLVRIGVKARDLASNRRPASNLVFLIDVSGSMATPEKLPLVKSGLKLLVDQLGENDVVSIVVYASGTGLVLPPTHGDRKDVIARTLDNLEAGGSTNGGAGIQLAYQQATANFIRGGVNRVILVTDGDFNVGVTDQANLTKLIEDRARSGVFLSVLGFGMGNLKDSTMERLADKGNGHYAYIDTLNEARKVLVEQMSSTLVTVAKDVKIQVDFNPAKVEAYRLLGYENRLLRPEDFNNDLKDAGEMGAGHTVTALFEIVPRGGAVPGPSVDPSVFQAPATRSAPQAGSNSSDLLVLRLRYKLPDAAESTRMDVPLPDRDVPFARADPDVRFAAAVAAFGMILKDSPYKGDATLEWVHDTAVGSAGRDRGGYRDEFVSLVRKAITLKSRTIFR